MRCGLGLSQRLLDSHRTIPTLVDVLLIDLAAIVFVDVSSMKHLYREHLLVSFKIGEDVYIKCVCEFSLYLRKIVKP